MNKRAAGMSFLFISAILFSTKYISAAIFGSGVASWDQNLFNAMLSYIGAPLTILSVVSFIAGFSYLAWGEYEAAAEKKNISDE
ncbi:hypothetical protein [Jeotgalibacillus proteolyticus]|uniref:hypothetical protein n=1 Tax=Jeotgalibacillus proteolyticus TaxID=2082395 RepID=UPI003CEF3D4B